MQTATQCKTVIEPETSILVRRESKHALLTSEQNSHSEVMGLSCLVMDEEYLDYAYQNKRRCT
ncbi:MAG: hypothetical protein KGZ37_04825 [Nitrosarchaeum sp.]|nr:hypothetical protein [Nitrosarchaeum sp.]